MIITQIIGGLGNQMFQYATGRALSLSRGKNLKLDISGFENYRFQREFDLDRIFNCQIDVATEKEIRGILKWQFEPVVRRIISRPVMTLYRRKEFVVEPHFNYWKKINNVPADCYLSGYWQSEKYFNDVAPQIRKDFNFRLPLEKQNAKLAEQIKDSNSVSLHIRRGDYVSDSKTGNVMELCSLDYYRNAISFVADRVEQPEFYVFSDDIEWVRSNLSVAFPCIFVDHNQGADSYIDMQLMSLCRHNIIANSSFSWWGAWLNSNPKKMVLAPKQWFRNGNDDRDLIPDGWEKL